MLFAHPPRAFLAPSITQSAAVRGRSKVWPMIFEKHLGTMPQRIYADCCAQFAVTKAAVLRHPRDFYLACYDWLMLSDIPSA
eukprot:8083410-Pyramimonas_sp.AAC.1